MKALPIAAATLALGACASIPADGEPPVRAPLRACEAKDAQRFVGQKADQVTAAAVLAATGSSRLRWLPPGAIVTMEFATERVNVSYDNAMIVTRVTCG